MQDILKIIPELRRRNPYPDDVFKNKEGKFGRQVWNNCVDELIKIINEDEDKELIKKIDHSYSKKR